MKGIEIYQITYVPKNGTVKPNGAKEVHSVCYDSKQAEATCRYLNAEALKGLDLRKYIVLSLDELIKTGYDASELIVKIRQMSAEFGLPTTSSSQIPKMAKYEDLVEILDMISLRFYCTSEEPFSFHSKSSPETLNKIKSKIAGSKTLLSLLIKQESDKRIELKSLEERISSEVKSILEVSVLCWKDEYPTINNILIYPKSSKCVVSFKVAHSINTQIEKEIALFCSELKYKNIKKAYNQRVVAF